MNSISDDEWGLVGYIRISSTRYEILKTLKSQFLMPSEIAKKNNVRTTQISKELKNLKEQNLIECKNESARKGRIYKITPVGLQLLEVLENNEAARKQIIT